MLHVIIGWTFIVITFLSIVGNFIQYCIFRDCVADWRNLAHNRGQTVIEKDVELGRLDHELEAQHNAYELLVRDYTFSRGQIKDALAVLNPPPNRTATDKLTTDNQPWETDLDS